MLLRLDFQSTTQAIQLFVCLARNQMVLEVPPLHLAGIFNTNLHLLVIYLDTIAQTHIQNPIYATAYSRTAALPRR